MDGADKFANNVLKKIGTIKNELLGFAIIVCLILNVFALPLDAMQNSPQKVGGLVMHLSSIPILLVFGGIYCFAFLRLPSSEQEILFTEEAQRMVRQHRRQQRARAQNV